MKQLDLNIVREYDIRGVAGKTLFAENGYNIGRALGTKALANGSKVINVGYDGRVSSPEISSELIRGVIESGCDVNDVGLVPSPGLYFSVFHLDVDYGIMVTASHNPKEYNGFKIISKKEIFYGVALKDFAKFVNEGNFAEGRGVHNKVDVKQDYLKKLQQELEGVDLSDVRIAWDPACGAAGEIVASLVENISGTNFLINENIDGSFPAHDPDPTIEENLSQLKQLVADNSCNIGLAFDGDADRIGVIDDEGEVLWGDQLVTLYAKDLLQDHPGSTVIADIKASKVFADKVSEFGGKPLIWKTGHSLIKAKMKEEGAPLAGEMSGHVFFSDKGNFGYDDGIYAAVRLIRIIVQKNIKLSDYRKSLPQTFSTKEEKVACPDDQKFTVVNRLKDYLGGEGIDFMDIDGVRVESDKGWWLIRASNTSPYLTTRCEGFSEADLEVLKNELQTSLQKCYQQ